MSATFEQILEKAVNTGIDEQEALQLFQESENEEKAQQLFQTASVVRDEVMGKTFKWSAGIASVFECKLKPHCLFCPYWTDPKAPLNMDEVLAAARYIEEQGIREFHLSAGTTLGGDGAEMVEMVRTLRNEGILESAITINCGAGLSQRSIEEMKKLGVTHISAIFETGNPKLFAQVKPGDSFVAKEQLVNWISDAGLEVGSGLLAGLGCRNCGNKCFVGPGEKAQPFSYQDYVDFIFKMQGVKNLRSIYVSRFAPFKGIRMANHPRCSASEGMRVIAVARLALRKVDIRLGAGWSHDDLPLWVQAGGGNNIIGVHVNRVPHYRNLIETPRPDTAYRSDVEYRNTMQDTARVLNELGIGVNC